MTFSFIPVWFRGYDCIFELVGALVLLLLAIYSYKISKIQNKKRGFWFFIAFLLISLSYFVKIFYNLNLYFPFSKTFTFFQQEIVYTSYFLLDLSSTITSFSRILFIFGLFILYYLITKSKEKRHLLLFTYMLLITIFLSVRVSWIFNLTSFILFAEIAYFYFENICKNDQSKYQKLMLSSYIILALSHLIHLFSFNSSIVVSAYFLEFIGFSLLLVDYILMVISK